MLCYYEIIAENRIHRKKQFVYKACNLTSYKCRSVESSLQPFFATFHPKLNPPSVFLLGFDSSKKIERESISISPHPPPATIFPDLKAILSRWDSNPRTATIYLEPFCYKHHFAELTKLSSQSEHAIYLTFIFLPLAIFT